MSSVKSGNSDAPNPFYRTCLREKPRSPVISNVEAVQKPLIPGFL